MSLRYKGNMEGERYLGDAKNKIVHDLKYEDLSCGIDRIINMGDDVPFNSLDFAQKQGFTPCKKCIY